MKKTRFSFVQVIQVQLERVTYNRELFIYSQKKENLSKNNIYAASSSLIIQGHANQNRQNSFAKLNKNESVDLEKNKKIYKEQSPIKVFDFTI